MVSEQTIREFVEQLSSKQPVPGGGGASGLAGALGTALGAMVANLTVGKKKYMDVEADMQEYLVHLTDMQSRFLCSADEDANVFAPLAASYGLPAHTEAEREYKERVMEENLLAASLVPMEVMETAAESLEVLKELARKGSRMAVSDVGVAVQFARTALLGAVMNVYINTKSMKDRAKADEINGRADRLAREGAALADEIYREVCEELRPEAQALHEKTEPQNGRQS